MNLAERLKLLINERIQEYFELRNINDDTPPVTVQAALDQIAADINPQLKDTVLVGVILEYKGDGLIELDVKGRPKD